MATGSTTPANSTTATSPPKKRSKLATILVVLAVLMIGFLIVVALQPGDFRVSRSLTINATPAATFEQVNDFHKWS